MTHGYDYFLSPKGKVHLASHKWDGIRGGFVSSCGFSANTWRNIEYPYKLEGLEFCKICDGWRKELIRYYSIPNSEGKCATN